MTIKWTTTEALAVTKEDNKLDKYAVESLFMREGFIIGHMFHIIKNFLLSVRQSTVKWFPTSGKTLVDFIAKSFLLYFRKTVEFLSLVISLFHNDVSEW